MNTDHMSPFFSIVIPCYNVAKYLPGCLESILGQKFEDFEVVIVDDGSADDIEAIVNRLDDKRVRLIKHGVNRSALQARITAVRNCTGEFIVPVDPDDRLEPNVLESLYRGVSAAPDCDCFVYGISVLLNGEWFPHDLRRLKPGVYTPVEFFSSVNAGRMVFWGQPGKIFRRSLYVSVMESHGIDDSAYFNAGEDILLTIPVLCRSKGINVLDIIGYQYIRRKNSLSSASDNPARVDKTIGDNGASLAYARRFADMCPSELRNRYPLRWCEELLIDTYFTRISSYPDALWGELALKLFANFDKALVWRYVFEKCKNRWCAFPYEKIVWPGAIKQGIRRIGIVCGSVVGGGTERATVLLSTHLASQGYEVILFVDEDRYDVSDASVDSLGVKDIVALPSRTKILDRWHSLVGALANRQIDAVIHTEYWREDTTTDIMATKVAGVKVVAAEHNAFFCPFYSGTPYYAKWHARVYRMVDVVTVLSPINEFWWNSAGVKNTVYMPNYLTFKPKYQEMANDKVLARWSAKNFIFVSRLTELKGVHKAIWAFASVSKTHPDATLSLVGEFADSGYQEYCRQQVDRLGLKGKVLFVGYVSRVEKFFDTATALLMCSQVEGAPMTLGEARAHGVPAVIYEMGFVDATSAADGVVSVPYDDVPGMSKALLELCSDFGRYKELSNAALRCVCDFSETELESRWRSVFDSVGMNDLSLMPKRAAVSSGEVADLTMREILKISGIIQGQGSACVLTSAASASVASGPSIKHMRSYVIGCAVTWPFRMVCGIIKCLGEHGLRYTLKRIPIKFANLHRRFFG